MRSNFDASLAAVLKSEGGYSNDPRDPGGATMRGVTQAVYDAWRVDHGLALQSVKFITPAEICAVYKRRYWDSVSGDAMPSGLDYCLFDFGINSGPGRASRYLQEALMVNVDGKIGPATMAAVAESAVPTLIDDICDLRLKFLQGLPTFGHFGNGWTARVADVRARAKGMAK